LVRKLLVALGVLVLLLLVADRVAPVVAGAAVAREVRSEAGLRSDPEVTIHGFPFLTQALSGRYDDVEVRARGVQVGDLGGIEVDSHFRGLHAPLGEVVGRTLDSVPVDVVDGTATIGYADLARAAGPPEGLTVDRITRDGDGMRVHGTVTVGGQTFRASAGASVRVSGDGLVVTARSVDVEDLPGGVPGLPDLAGRFGFSVPLRGLPFHLRITDVRAADDGLHVSAQARDLVLGQGGLGG
jgi:hypothetical protein